MKKNLISMLLIQPQQSASPPAAALRPLLLQAAAAHLPRKTPRHPSMLHKWLLSIR